MAKNFDVRIVAHFTRTDEQMFSLDRNFSMQEIVDCLYWYCVTNRKGMYIECYLLESTCDVSDIKAEWNEIVNDVKFTFNDYARKLIKQHNVKLKGTEDKTYSSTTMSGSSVYVVKFRDGFNPLPEESEDGEFYFSSAAAIYTKFTPEQIGCKVNTLWQNNITKGQYFINKCVIIKRNPLYSKRNALRASGSDISDKLYNCTPKGEKDRSEENLKK